MAEHTYPSDHQPGSHWATTEAWEIMDMIPPGGIPDSLRFLMAGMIAGCLIRVVRETEEKEQLLAYYD